MRRGQRVVVTTRAPTRVLAFRGDLPMRTLVGADAHYPQGLLQWSVPAARRQRVVRSCAPYLFHTQHAVVHEPVLVQRPDLWGMIALDHQEATKHRCTGTTRRIAT